MSIAILAYSLGLIIGTIGAVCKLHGSPLTKRILFGYTTLVRAVPELVLILILYYAGSTVLNSILESMGYEAVAINGFVAAVFVLGFVQGAYHRGAARRHRGDPDRPTRSRQGLWHVVLLEFRR